MESPPLTSPSIEVNALTPPSRDNAAAVLSATIRELMRDIESDRAQWSFGDKLGVAYHFVGDRLYKTNNVLNRSGVRSRIEMRTVDQFFARLNTILPQDPFVKVELCGGAQAYLMYCHSRLVKLEPGRCVLLMGDVCLARGHFNNYFVEPIPVAPGTRVRLYSRTYEIRISSHRHTIFIRTEDLVKDRVRLEPLAKESMDGLDGGADGDSKTCSSSSDEDDQSETEGEDSFDGGTSADESSTTTGRVRRTVATQTTPPANGRRPRTI